MIVLGIDPGASGAAALVQYLPGVRPTLLGAWSVYGTTPEWWRRAQNACVSAVSRSVVGDAALSAVALELPGGAGATRDRRSPAWLLGLGRSIGRWEGLARQLAPDVPIETIDSGEWPRALRLRVGKAKGRTPGLHRLTEARFILQVDPLAPCDFRDGQTYHSIAAAERAVAQAEAALIACAVLFTRINRERQ